jgi:hypothetical protein
MKIHYTNTNGRLQFEADAATVKEAFEWLSTIQELFEETACGLCGKENLNYEVREYDGNNYYKLVCRDCQATLDFGQRRDGNNLFIKRKDAEGNTLPNSGWYRYQGANGAKPTATPAPTRREPARRGGEPAARRANEKPVQSEPVPF